MIVNVSDLNRYNYCPRSLYLERIVGLKPPETQLQVKGLLGHALRKELSLRQAKIVKKAKKKGEFRDLLFREFEAVIREAPYIYRERLPKGFEKHIPYIREHMEVELDLMTGKLEAMTEIGRAHV